MTRPPKPAGRPPPIARSGRSRAAGTDRRGEEGGEEPRRAWGGAKRGGRPVGTGPGGEEVAPRLGGGRGPHAGHALAVEGEGGVEQDEPFHQSGKAQRHVLNHRPAEVA